MSLGEIGLIVGALAVGVPTVMIAGIFVGLLIKSFLNI